MSNTKSKHIRRSADQWASVLSDQRASGLSQVEFCRREGIALSTFARWRQRLSGAEQATSRDEPWIELSDLPGTRAGWDIELDRAITFACGCDTADVLSRGSRLGLALRPADLYAQAVRWVGRLAYLVANRELAHPTGATAHGRESITTHLRRFPLCDAGHYVGSQRDPIQSERGGIFDTLYVETGRQSAFRPRRPKFLCLRPFPEHN